MSEETEQEQAEQKADDSAPEPVSPTTIKLEMSDEDLAHLSAIRSWARIGGWAALAAGIVELLTLLGALFGLLLIFLGIHLLALTRNADVFLEKSDPAALTGLLRRIKLSLIFGSILAVLYFGIVAALVAYSLISKQGILALLGG